MNLQNSHDLLTFVASVDNRKFDDATVIAWQQILADVEYDDAMFAAIDHFAVKTEYLMPVHVRAGALALVRDRKRVVREQRELEAAATEVHLPLTDRSAEIQAFVRGVRDILPPSDPAKLRPRDAYWRREQRIWNGEPNPHYVPSEHGSDDAAADTAEVPIRRALERAHTEPRRVDS